jgi:MYXO-CTERM domain-containing protein
MRVTLLAGGLGLLLLHARGAAAAPIKVACVGDSITQNSGWPDRLGAKLGAGYTSTNYGLSGTTLLKNGDHPYWGTQPYKDSHSANPDIVVIMLGTNDSKAFNWNAHKGEFVGDYEALIDTYASLPSHPKIYLNLCPPAGTNGYQIVGTTIENEVIPDIKQVAAAKSLPTIDIFDAFGGHNLDQSLYASPTDLAHPNAKGAQLLADLVYAALTAPPSDGGAGAGGAPDGGAPDGGAGGARADAASGVDGAGGVGGAAGAASGTGGGAGGATSGGGSGGGNATGVAGASGGSGAAGTGPTGAAGAATGVAGGSGGSGAAGTGSPPPHASSGGCAVAATTPEASAALVLVLGLAWLGARRRRGGGLG